MTVETLIRLASFGSVLAVMALAERLFPRRDRTLKRRRRWPGNLGLAGLNAIAVRYLVPVGGVGVALVAQQHNWGLLHQVQWPYWIEIGLAVAALDLVIYLQHVMFHAVPVLWRLHMVHHADPEFDVTTGVRFHTIEILISMVIKMGAVAVLGPNIGAVILFEILLNATAMFNHSNLKLPLPLDRFLRLVLVTPDMHRVHHSVHPNETNSNFGFNLPWWDYLCGTYTAQPKDGHVAMKIGLTQFQSPKIISLFQLLGLPFKGSPGRYAVKRD